MRSPWSVESVAAVLRQLGLAVPVAWRGDPVFRWALIGAAVSLGLLVSRPTEPDGAIGRPAPGAFAFKRPRCRTSKACITAGAAAGQEAGPCIRAERAAGDRARAHQDTGTDTGPAGAGLWNIGQVGGSC